MIANRISLAFRALRQMGFRPLALYGLYQLGLQTGHYRRMTAAAPTPEGFLPTAPSGEPASQMPASQVPALRAAFGQPAVGPEPALGSRPPAAGELRENAVLDLLSLPSQEALAAVLGSQARDLLVEGDEVTAGKVRLFGADPVPLDLQHPGPLVHWTVFEQGTGVDEIAQKSWVPVEGRKDIKFTWEPGRFGWAYILGRAYRLSGEERYARAFWEYADVFLDANPPNLGLHWVSAQEVALRLIALVFAGQVFSSSAHTTSQRARRLAQVIAVHAGRIPPTLVYARSQNNNHLLVEAAGLYTAGCVLPDHPSAGRWRESGWRWLHTGLQSQFASDGAYTQNSTNYHRLALQAALWAWAAAGARGEAFPQKSLDRLAAATRWLLALVDPWSGQAPNLGPNDGAYIFPLAACPFQDYRPVLQASSRAFLGERPFADGPWDEMGLWLGSHGIGDSGKGKKTDAMPHRPYPLSPVPLSDTPHILRSPSGSSWAYLRVARHTSRPGHADPLHLDLWWQGLNVAQDAGTYLYNGAPPWENALSSGFVHNTVTVDGQEPMRRAGRFLWLDWAQGQAVEGAQAGDGSWQWILAQHDGYRRMGVLHQRRVSADPDRVWIIEDCLIPVKPSITRKEHSARLHWLLPDWPWEVEKDSEGRVSIRIKSPNGWIALQVASGPASEPDCPHPGEGEISPVLSLQLVRAGELIEGHGPVSPTWGWVSPTYGQKNPALSFAVIARGQLPLLLNTTWIFPDLEQRRIQQDRDIQTGQ